MLTNQLICERLLQSTPADHHFFSITRQKLRFQNWLQVIITEKVKVTFEVRITRYTLVSPTERTRGIEAGAGETAESASQGTKSESAGIVCLPVCLPVFHSVCLVVAKITKMFITDLACRKCETPSKKIIRPAHIVSHLKIIRPAHIVSHLSLTCTAVDITPSLEFS